VSVSLEAIRSAAAQLGDAVVRTPCLHSQTLSEISGARVWLKFENLQFTASFKDRGARVKLLSLPDQARARGVVAMSAGNHAQAVARHAQLLGIPATIVMPRFTPNVKVEHTRAFGARVVLHGETLEEAAERAHELEREGGLTFVHPYDDEDVIRGQGTIALEMLEAQPDLEVLLLPVGGGGLIAGNAVAAHGLRPDLEVIGVETSRFPSMAQALRGEPIECGRTTIADGIAVKEPGSLTLPLVREHVREILLVEEREIEDAVLLLLEVEKTVVEGAGAVGLAALLARPERFAGRRVGLVISGGNVDLLTLSSIIQRGLVHSARLVRLRVEVEDRPGALADVCRCIADADGNVVAVHHQRAFTSSPLKAAEVEFVLQTRGPQHIQEILDRLSCEGYSAQLPDQIDANEASRSGG
jgi:threonine dehydratase